MAASLGASQIATCMDEDLDIGSRNSGYQQIFCMWTKIEVIFRYSSLDFLVK
jgi:hypothetical protein